MTDCTVRSRIDPHVKAQAMHIFAHMGLTLSEAIRMFLYQSVASQSIPFSINIPNAKTRAALETVKSRDSLEKTNINQLAQEWHDACVK